MKQFLRALVRALPHLVLILAVMMLTFFVIDRVNAAMAFLNNELTKWLLAVFSLLAAILAVIAIVKEEKNS